MKRSSASSEEARRLWGVGLFAVFFLTGLLGPPAEAGCSSEMEALIPGRRDRARLDGSSEEREEVGTAEVGGGEVGSFAVEVGTRRLERVGLEDGFGSTISMSEDDPILLYLEYSSPDVIDGRSRWNWYKSGKNSGSINESLCLVLN